MMPLIALLVCWLLMAAPAGAAPCPPEPALPRVVHQALFEAHQLMDQNQPAQAQAKLRALVQEHPDQRHHRLSFMLGMLAYQTRDLPQAQTHLSQAVELYPCFSLGWRNLAVVQYERGHPLEAAQSMLRAHELGQPPDPELRYQAAAFYLEAKRPHQALDLLISLAREARPRINWLKALVQTHLLLEQWVDGERVARRLLNQAPADASLWRLTAGIAAQRKRYGQAAADLEVAYRLAEPDAPGCRQLAELYQAAGVPQKAAVWYLRAFGPTPQPAQWETLAQVYRQAGMWDQALEAAQNALAQPNAQRQVLLAELRLQRRQYAQAARGYAQAARLGSRADHWLLAGQCAWQADLLDQAQNYLDQAVSHSQATSADGRQARQTLAALREYRQALAARAKEDPNHE